MKKGDVKQTRLFTKKVSEKRTFEQLVDEYIRQCEITNKAHYTIRIYKHHSRYFMQFIGENFPCENINLSLVEDYIEYLRDIKGLDNGVTLNSYLRNISPIIKFGYKKRYILYNFEIPTVKEQETFKEIYNKEELDLILDKPKKNDFTTLRTWTMLCTFSSMGIRARELRELQVKNVDLLNRVITVNKTKNKKARYLPISASLHEVLEQYLEIRGGEG
ncbi:recombinase [Clostridioides difficile]|nr:recombinase [Clostridioides difficile]VIG11180.1 recombinase [Clostridioides difficile]HBE9438107.1 tyrosine-type recombinase/integrase [Clostridioides difficile]HBF4439735.1 tyrosine-type recombinase/integrase [Clostridioides difficile]HBF4772533.1 tyrosine-type recombinase/integrase [Clostridioides difficile]